MIFVCCQVYAVCLTLCAYVCTTPLCRLCLRGCLTIRRDGEVIDKVANQDDVVVKNNDENNTSNGSRKQRRRIESSIKNCHLVHPLRHSSHSHSRSNIVFRCMRKRVRMCTSAINKVVINIKYAVVGLSRRYSCSLHFHNNNGSRGEKITHTSRS